MIRNGIASMVGLIATIVRVVCSVIGALIVIHAVFVLFSANPQNVLVEFTAGIRDTFGWFTKNLFTPKDAKIGQAINDALAGLIWVIVGNLASRLILRFAPAKKSSDKKSAKNETPRATPVRQSQKPAEQPKEEKKAEQPKDDEPQAEQPAAAEKKPPENQPESGQEEGAVPKVPSPAAVAVLQPESEPESGAKHEARATARREESAQEEPSEDESAEEEPAADKAQA